MDIHADPRFLVADRYHQIGCLSADACEGHQLVDRLRHLAFIYLEQPTANGMDGFGFRPVEANGIDCPFDTAL
jgi:hypothetical protein